MTNLLRSKEVARNDREQTPYSPSFRKQPVTDSEPGADYSPEKTPSKRMVPEVDSPMANTKGWSA